MNGFKIFNDTFGHTEGDNALKVVAAKIKNMIGEGDILARVGGDEFANNCIGKKESEIRRYLDKLELYSENDSQNSFEDNMITYPGVMEFRGKPKIL